eukprot:1182804-Amorphochlora_amoeboformis.AAC.1
MGRRGERRREETNKAQERREGCPTFPSPPHLPSHREVRDNPRYHTYSRYSLDLFFPVWVLLVFTLLRLIFLPSELNTHNRDHARYDLELRRSAESADLGAGGL